MSGIYNELQEGSYNELLSRRFSMKISSPASALVPEVGPSIVVENDRFEWGFLKRENAYGVTAFQAATVGQKGGLEIANVSTNSLVVLDSLTLNSPAILTWARASIIGSVGGAAVLPRAADFRNAQTSTSLCSAFLSVGDPVNLGVFGEQHFIGYRPLNIVIAPRTSLLFWNFTANQIFSMSATFRERAASASELV